MAEEDVCEVPFPKGQAESAVFKAALEKVTREERFLSPEFTKENGYVPRFSGRDAVRLAEGRLGMIASERALALFGMIDPDTLQSGDPSELIVRPDEIGDGATFGKLYEAVRENQPGDRMKMVEERIGYLEDMRAVVLEIAGEQPNPGTLHRVGDYLVKVGEGVLAGEPRRARAALTAGWRRSRAYYDGLQGIGVGLALLTEKPDGLSLEEEVKKAVEITGEPESFNKEEAWSRAKAWLERAQGRVGAIDKATKKADFTNQIGGQSVTVEGAEAVVDAYGPVLEALVAELQDGAVESTKQFLFQAAVRLCHGGVADELVKQEVRELVGMARGLEPMTPEDFGRKIMRPQREQLLPGLAGKPLFN